VEVAANLLYDRGMSIETAAARCGFSDARPSHRPCRSSLGTAALVIGLVIGAPSVAQESDPSLKDWQDDLTTMVDALETIHPRPFWRIAPDTFRRAVERLHGELGALDNAQRTAGSMELVALLQDGHTRLWPTASGAFATSYPIRLQRLADGVWVRAAARAAASLCNGS